MAKTSILPIADDRLSDRAEVQIAAGLRTSGGRRVPIVVRNISPDGFMAEGASMMVPGSIVSLDIGVASFEVRIVWKRSGHIGGMFIEPLTEEAFAAII